jgi:N-acetylglutamate synthase-like GNAT family acetyltransferase
MLNIRNARTSDIADIEGMVSDFVRGHPAENHPRSSQALRAAYFGDRPVAQLLVAERNGEIIGMAQWRLIHDMFWGMFGAEAEWLYVKPECRGSGVVAALVARLCAQASEAGAEFLHGGGRRRAIEVIRTRCDRTSLPRVSSLWKSVPGIRKA